MALVLVSLRKTWKNLIPTKGDSLGQLRRFFDTVAALMSRQLRSMALASLEELVDHMSGYSAGNDWRHVDEEGKGRLGEQSMIIPMLNLRCCPIVSLRSICQARLESLLFLSQIAVLQSWH